MRRLWVFIFVIFLFNSCSAQQSFDLKNASYYSASSNRWTAVINITPDSIFLFKKKEANIIDKQSFEIVDRENRDGYLIMYIKNKTRQIKDGNNRSFSLPPVFGAYVFALSKDKNQLFVLKPSYQQFKSLDEVKNANPDGSFGNKYFFSWYSQSKFTELTKYPDFLNADKATVQKVSDDWVNELKESADKIRNAHIGDMYGAGTGNDILSKVLVRNYLNPMANLSDLNKKTTEYHIPVPNISFRSSRPINRIDTNHSKPKDIVIDRPTGN